jgi:Mor family transcriptional regulator
LKYKKAESILPEHLLLEVQKYIQGEILYIPTIKGTRKMWGERSGNKAYLLERNERIRDNYLTGSTINQLATEYCLSVDSIKKIVYKKQMKKMG